MALDPAVGWTLRLFLVALFARSLYGKLRAPSEFAAAVRGYALLPDRLAPLAAAGLLAVELMIVSLLLIPAFAPTAAVTAAGLLVVYAIAIAINLARGRRDIDCGCAGPLRRQSLHELLIGRNFVYAMMATAAAFPLAPRDLGGIDAATVTLAFIALTTLASALDGLAALAPRLVRAGVRR